MKQGKKNLVGTFDEKRVVLTAYFQDLNIKIKDVEALSIIDLIKGLKKVEATEAIRYKIEIFRKLALVFFNSSSCSYRILSFFRTS